MKVLIWTQYFWPENFHINAVARSLHEQGAEVTVLTGKPNYPAGKVFAGYQAAGIQREKYAGFDVIRIPLRERGSGSALGLAMNYLSFVLSGYLFAPYALRGKRFDVVFIYAPSPLVQAMPAIFVAWLKRAPVVLWVQDIWPDALQSTGFVRSRWLLGMVRAAVRYIYRYADSILIQSEGFRASVEGLVSNTGKIRYFPNSAEDVLAGNATSGQSNLAKEIGRSFAVVFAGNIGTAQSCETIIDAAKLLRDARNIKFFLVGDGSMAGAITESIAAGQLDNVVMTGRVAAEDMGAIYASASVLLLTLRDDPALSATIPSKLQGYLAAGKPIIVSSNGESAKVVSKANAGSACPAGDAEALAKAVLGLYEMQPEERDCLGKNGRKYFMAHYYLPDRVAELAAHFKDVAARHD
ncbi:MAG: glycosyltransferase family 4 protein [Nitrosomonadales bacterium]|nr:glycosyltransferase family 4 protein [Nitrosomonadales bacterium]